LLAWFCRNTPASQARQAVVQAYTVCYSLAFVVALLAQLAKVLNYLGWGTVALNLVLAVGYAYFLFRPEHPD
jgi:predicted exporter